jgi:hypothetical protein
MDTVTQVTDIVRSRRLLHRSYSAGRRRRSGGLSKRRWWKVRRWRRMVRAHGVNANRVLGWRKLTGGVRNAPGTRNYPRNARDAFTQLFLRRGDGSAKVHAILRTC